MTITRLFLYVTFVACPLWAGVALAHAGPGDEPASAATSGVPVAATAKPSTAPSHVHSSAAHAQGAPAPKKTVKRAAAQQASADDTYRLSHQPRQLDSYQRAVTPPVTTDR